MIENTIDNKFLARIHTEEHGFGAHNTQDVIAWLYTTYGRLTVTALADNSIELTKPVPTTKPITAIFWQVENCQKKATVGGIPFTQE